MKDREKEFRQYQEDALEYCRVTENPALLMEMRLGKTSIAIRHFKEVKAKKVLIVCPISTTSSWIKELESEDVNYSILTSLSREKRQNSVEEFDAGLWQDTCLVTNYESLSSEFSYKGKTSKLLTYPWDLVILDESTRIKNPKSAVSKIAVNFFRDSRRMILTGTPAPEGELDLFQQFLFLNGNFLGYRNYWSFFNAYYVRDYDYSSRLKSPRILDTIKNEIHKLSFVRTVYDCGMVTGKVYETRTILPNSQQRVLHKSIENFYAYKDPTTKELVEMTSPLQAFTALRRVSGGFSPDGSTCISEEKYKEIKTLLAEDLHSNNVIVWFSFRKELAKAHEFFKKAFPRKKIAVITGDVPLAERRKITEKGGANLLLVIEQAASHGINLSRFDTSIYFSRGTSTERRVQSEDRIVLLQGKSGTKSTKLIIDLVCDNTIDSEIHKLMEEKSMTSKMIMKNLKEKYGKKEKRFSDLD